MRQQNNIPIRYCSVCSGVEAATLAWHDLGWIPVFYAEVEPFPSAVLMQRFGATKPKRPLLPEEAVSEKDAKERLAWAKEINRMPDGGTIPNLGDFTKIKKEDYNEKIDLLVGGTPCQSFSVAGNRKGLSGVSGLALEFIRLAYETGCRWVVWENVPGVFSTNRGRDFAAFLSGLTGQQIETPDDGWRTAGLVRNGRNDRFGVAWRTLDAQYVRTHQFPYAVPQRRRRVFVVGYFGDWQPAAKVLLEPERLSWNTPPRIKTRQASAGDVGKSAENANIKLCYENHAQNSKVKETRISPVITARCGTGGNNLPLVVSYCLAEKIINRNIKNSVNGLGCSEELAYTITTGGVHAAAKCYPLDVRKILRVADNGVGINFNSEVNYTVAATKIPGVAVARCYPLDLRNALRNYDKMDCINRQGCGVGGESDASATITAAFIPGVAVVNYYNHDIYCSDLRVLNIMLDFNVCPTILAACYKGVPVVIQPDAMAEAHTVTVNSNHNYMPERKKSQCVLNSGIRRLTPLECERLMGFLDYHTRIKWRGKEEQDCPDNLRYKACGNSMCVNVMLWIGERIDAVEKEIKNGKKRH